MSIERDRDPSVADRGRPGTVLPEQDMPDARTGEREGGIGAMREIDTDGVMGGGPSRSSLGAERTAGAASDGAGSGGGADPLTIDGPDADTVAQDQGLDQVFDVAGRDAPDPALPSYAPGHLGRPPQEPLRPQGPGDRVEHAGTALEGEDLPDDLARDSHPGDPIGG